MPDTTEQAVNSFMEGVDARNPGQPEFQQAVREFASSVIPFIDANPKYAEANILERLTEPDRAIQFRVTWVDDDGKFQTNRAYRVQFNNAIGPYKGGLRFHPSVNLSIVKFLGFEQIFKNSLTTLPMGGAKGGADFDPRGRSDGEVMRFCHAMMTELSRYIGKDEDVPAGDIGVGSREIGYLFGQFKRIRGTWEGAMTGKALAYGGSLIRPEATGYGCVYFVSEMLKRRSDDIDGKTCVVSGSGNVAQYTAEKINQLGGTVLTLSDSEGFIHDPDGIDEDKLAWVMALKNERRGRIKEYAKEYSGASFHADERPWSVACDLAFPSATQNELKKEDAETLVKNGVMAVGEGANMPSTLEAIDVFDRAGVMFAPAKAANAGGVAVSGLEQSQNAMRISWDRKDVDQRLQQIMASIHEKCVSYGYTGDHMDYVAGANIAGFVKVADAMLSYGAM